MQGSTARADTLAALIRPVTTSSFFERHFEREVLHIERRDETYFTTLYNVGCIEDALAASENAVGHFALVKHGQSEQTEMTAERISIWSRGRDAPRVSVDPRKVLAAFAAGSSLVIKDAGVFHPHLARLCDSIQAGFGIYAQVNVYFTPAHAQAFGIHHDTHDTLVVQIEGAKNWEVHEPILSLPLQAQSVPPGSIDESRLTTPRQFRVAAGDSLYVPRGFLHKAMTSDRRSIHLTFALAPLRVVDLLESLVQLAARENMALRQALPVCWQQDPTFATSLRRELMSVLTPAIIARAAELAHNDRFAATRAPSAGLFDALAALDEIDATSHIELRTDTPFALRDRGESLDIVVASKVITLPATAEPGMKLLQAGDVLTFAQLEAALPVGTATSFLRVLALEGLVHIHPRAPSRR